MKSAPPKILIVGERITVVDLADAIKAAGFDVTVIAPTPDPLSRIRFEFPSLVVLDLHPPKSTGFDVCRMLKQDWKVGGIPVIIASARSEQTDCIVALELGADDYVAEPFNGREVVLRICGSLDRFHGPSPHTRNARHNRRT